jgi:aquaporin Z
MKKEYTPYIAEFIGTFGLSFLVAMSLTGVFPIPVPVAAALTLGLFVYSIGHISGTQINPAVTLGLLSIKKISVRDAAFYIVAQFLGAVLAMGLSRVLGIHPLDIPNNLLRFGIAEVLGTFFFTFGIAAVVHDKVPKAMSGVVVGGSLLLGVIISSATGGAGILNPAVALAIDMFSPMYLIGPIVGSVLGFNLYEVLNDFA